MTLPNTGILFSKQHRMKSSVGRCGNTFDVVDYEHYSFINPNGDSRTSIYTLFRKTAR